MAFRVRWDHPGDRAQPGYREQVMATVSGQSGPVQVVAGEATLEGVKAEAGTATRPKSMTCV